MFNFQTTPPLAFAGASAAPDSGPDDPMPGMRARVADQWNRHFARGAEDEGRRRRGGRGAPLGGADHHGGPPHRGGPPFRGRRGRARRGDVRAALLALLAEEPRHGYQLIQELADRTDGAWRASPGSVYPTLAQLEDEGLVRADQEGGKRVFHLTDAGRAEVDAREGAAPWDDFTSDGSGPALFREVALFMAAAKQFRHVGTPSQHEAAARVVANARRELYGMLASDVDSAGADGGQPERG